MTDEATPEAAPYIKLDQFLKWQGAVESGGAAKVAIASGDVKVNGEPELRRGRKLRTGDRVELADQSWTVDLQAPTAAP